MNQYPRIRDLREDADLTQAQVGERLGLSQRTSVPWGTCTA